MEKIKKYFLSNFEQIFVLIILISVSIITYFAPYKIAFLNFFYVPIFLAAIYLNTRSAVLGAFFVVLLILTYAYLYKTDFTQAHGQFDLWAKLVTWGSFLVLSGVIIGKLTEKLKMQSSETQSLDKELEAKRNELEHISLKLQEYSEDLETKVKERTSNLEKSNRLLEEHKDRVEDALYATMDSSVVKMMIENRLRNEKRRISLLFSDISNFTQYTDEKRAEEVITELNVYLSTMEEVLLDYQAHIDKYMGDGIMAEFGAPIAYARHALMAVLAGLKMQESIQKNHFPWQVRIGIATGEPIIGIIGNKRQSYTALGDVVNLASRIESICTPGQVTVDEETWKDVERFFIGQPKSLIQQDGQNTTEILYQISDLEIKLTNEPSNMEILTDLIDLQLSVMSYNRALELIKSAMLIEPKNKSLKVLYTDTILKNEEQQNVLVKGRKAPVHLYEILQLKNPINNQDKIPKSLCDHYQPIINELIPFPEDLIIPIECLDGTIGRGKTVGFLSYIMADLLNLDDQDKLDILEAGYLGDIGKSIVPHHILNRSGSLSTEEMKFIHMHCREGVRKLKQKGYESDSLFRIIQNHHESYDGTGYPEGIQGNDIPIGARILAIAEGYEALTSWRCYREPWEYRAAIIEMQKDALRGKYDPNIMGIFAKLILDESVSTADLEQAQLAARS